MKRIAAVAVMGTLLASTHAFGAESVWAKVNGMVCAFCAQGIEAKLRALPQAQDVYVNLAQKVVAVELKDGAVLSTDVVKEVVQDAGYDVAAIEVVSKTTAQIKSETRKK